MNLARAFACLVPSGVIGLLFRRRPPAIARFVITIVVDPVQGIAPPGPGANIGDKGKKIVPPSVAHSNTAASPKFELRQARIVATRFHADPRTMFRAMRNAMLIAGRRSSLSLNAPTTFRRSAPKVAGHHDGLTAARTFTQPSNALPLVFRLPQHRKPSETLARQINLFHG